MPTETLTENGNVAVEAVPEIGEAKPYGTPRAQALERIYRLRRFKLHAAVFAVGVPLLGALWVLTEYFEEHTWPERFASDPDVAGTWDPWFFFVAGLWTIALAIHALRTYLGPPVGPLQRWIHRPPGDAEIVSEIERLR